MGDRFDDVAKGLATGMSRRRLLKLLAGGLAAAVGSRVAGVPASVDAHEKTSKSGHGHIGVNQTFPWRPGLNQSIPPWYPGLNQSTHPWHPGLNQSVPPWYPGVNQTVPRPRPGMNQGFPWHKHRKWEQG
jgi:hypothetical protein